MRPRVASGEANRRGRFGWFSAAVILAAALPLGAQRPRKVLLPYDMEGISEATSSAHVSNGAPARYARLSAQCTTAATAKPTNHA